VIDSNPAKGEARRVRERAPARSYPDSAGQSVALLDAAADLDRKAPEVRRHVEQRIRGSHLRVYRQAMRRDEDERARLRAFVEGADWADTGERAAEESRQPADRGAA
jgi:hypothetical protein